ncbi:TonB family protein [Aggregicoccus sp. 17bor-14]|uniref:TonB-dependent receptor plug domain-containing protein n=1 Tax=Myxococcaceae TaxID=31 RepID=UPI00129D03FC|nr:MULTISPECIES: TonB family protein [Myxococcaceae]MBF5046599.1 TonB family protein [Simulacricoccus sp. 17bor-14]MRI92310.1 TonB family protein [Aggregicoccus sp. 17bor-14]
MTLKPRAAGGLLAASLLLLSLTAFAQPQQGVLTRPPELEHTVEAVYPPEAAQQGLTASVRFFLTIDASGAVAEALVQDGPVGHGFDEAALAAVRQFRFRPAEVDGVPAPVQLEYTYHFTLAPPPSPEPAAAAVPRAVLRGQLLSRGSRARVPSATVRCGDGADAPEAESDAEGRFTLDAPAGACAVSVVAPGHQLFRTQEQLAANETLEVAYYLVPQGTGLQTIVHGTREKKEVVRRTLNRDEATKTPGTMGDPIRVLQTLPGLARAPYLSGDLLVRGSNPGQTSALMDGVKIPLLFHLLGGPSVINPEFIDSLDFYPGGFGSQYGRAVGGIADVATRKGASDTLHGSFKVDVLDTALFLEAPMTDGVSVSGAVRRSYVDTVLKAVLPQKESGGTLVIVPRYYDYQLRVDVGARAEEGRPAGRSTYSVMGFGSDDQLRLVDTGGDNDRDYDVSFHTHFDRLRGAWNYRHGGLSSTFVPYVGYDRLTSDFGNNDEHDSLWSLGARETLALELSSRVTARVGADLLYSRMSAHLQLPVATDDELVPFPGSAPRGETQTLHESLGGLDGALFVEADLKLGRLTATPGLRANLGRTSGHSPMALDPRLFLRLQTGEHTALKGSLGLYSQSPDVWQFMRLPYGNPELGYARAFQSSLGVEHHFDDSFSVDVTGFFNRRYANVVAPGQVHVLPDGSVARERYSNDGLGRAYGVEVMVKKELTERFSGWLSYTLSHAEDGRAGADPQSPSQGAFGEGQTLGYDLSPYDQTHVLTLVGSYKLPHGWELGGRFRFTSGRPVTPLVHDSDLYQVDGNQYGTVRGLLLSERTRGFHQLDMRVEKGWTFERWTLSAYLDVQNLYNAQNQEGVLTDYRNRREYELPGLPILPVVGVKGSF